MDAINAIAKARFASARPQRVQLHREGAGHAELICFEAEQVIEVDAGRWLYYVINGRALIAGPDGESALTAGQVAVTAPHEPHTLANHGEGRLICLAVAMPAD